MSVVLNSENFTYPLKQRCGCVPLNGQKFDNKPKLIHTLITNILKN